jgi:NAD(P)-dependent dehydrogenase (short-subunit alcohol dehydrogenase family)
MSAGKAEAKVAVVTGASRGLGLETCRVLAEKGLDVVLTARAEDMIASALKALGEPANVAGHVLDVSDDGSVDAFFDWLRQDRGRIDVLVNNAGRVYGGWGRNFASTDVLSIAEAVDNNAIGAFRTIRRALPLMNARNYGRVVNVSSGMGQLSDMNGGAIPYRLSKTALNAVTRIAAAEAGPNVKVNSVCPGWVRTELGSQSAPRDVEEGAAGIVWAATLPDDGPSGGFFRDAKPIDW